MKGRPRTPLAKAIANGRTLHDPARFADRREPGGLAPLGDPSSHVDDPLELHAWNLFRHEVPWLMESDRALVEIAAKLRAKLWANGSALHIPTFMALLRCLSMMGATSTERSRVSVPPSKEPDPGEEFMQ